MDGTDDSSAATDHLTVRFPEGTVNRAMEGLWSRLPDEISERVLSFLPVPALCRCLSVCKKWNDLIRKQSFLDLCDLHGGNRAHLFVTRHLSLDKPCHSLENRSWRIRTTCFLERTTSFLDLDEGRWYSIPADASLPVPADEDVLRLLAIDDGLVCEFSQLPGEYKLVMVDPVAKTRRKLPLSTSDGKPVCNHFGDDDPEMDDLPVIVTVVDKAGRSFKVFLMNRDCNYEQHTGDFSDGPPPHAWRNFVYESSTDAWRRLGNPPTKLLKRRGRLGESAVYFQGKLYVVFREDDGCCYSIILSYDLPEALWREVLVVGVRSIPGYPQLVVSGNRIFMATWALETYPSRKTRTYSPYFEIREMFEDQEVFGGWSYRALVKIQYDDLYDVDGSKFGIAWGFPLGSSSAVLISLHTGRLLTYDLRSGHTLNTLPAHPLHTSEQVVMELREQGLSQPHYCAKLSSLSLRNILSAV